MTVADHALGVCEVTSGELCDQRSGGPRGLLERGDVGEVEAGRLRLRTCLMDLPRQRLQGSRSQRPATEQVEPVFNTHPQVRRTALVGVGDAGRQRPVLCYELMPGVIADRVRIEAELREIGAGLPHTARIGVFLPHPGFPVDIRHNAKIGRETLAVWAATQQEQHA